MEKLHDDLREVMGLLGKATPGPWEWSVNGNIIPVPYGDTEIAAVYSEHEDDRAPANAEAIIAAVAFLRQHGPALLARQEREDARDGARYRWLRSQEEIIIRTDDFEWYPDDSYPATTKEGLDAAIDAARSGGGG